MSSAVDSNLLFGVLAFQNDLITREQLVAGVKIWVGAKQRLLADILEEMGALSAARRALLEPLVEAHVHQHADDPAQCLASLSSIGSLYDELAQVPDPQLAASLKALAPVMYPTDAWATMAQSIGQSSSEGTRFRMLRRRFRGGMGAIYEAEDLELKRVVAVKEILPEYAADQNARMRFTYEAEITGLLEHPSVVPVYGLGTYADGRPFYAMRFIKGSNLEKAINDFHQAENQSAVDPGQRSLKLRELLGRFIDVCQAIHYAHDRGVLHRDLKPGNIMLGEYGETLVVDWGLAKVVGRKDIPVTLSSEPLVQPASGSMQQPTRHTVGTYDYMAPEQAHHRQDLMGPAADIFSLGATLYHLLTGRTPYHGLELEEKIEHIEETRFPPPRQVNKEVPRPLEAICMKAMAREPAHRYASARDLVSDLKHWLADEPVSAWREPLLARLSRWMRRHRTLVINALAALLAVLAILAVSLVVIQRSYVRERAARNTAQENLRLARSAVDEMLLQVGSEQLADVPQMESVRLVLLGKAADFYRQFSKQVPHDAGLQLEIARARHSLGDVYRILKDTSRSQREYGAAVADLERLSQAEPNEPKYRAVLATTHNWLGEALRPIDSKRAERQYQSAKSLQEKLVAAHPGDYEYKQQLAQSTYNLGILCDSRGQPNQAVKHYDRAIVLLKAALDQKPPIAGATGCQQELARSYNNRAKSLRALGQAEAAAESYRVAIGLLENLEKAFPRNREYVQELAVYYNNLANLQRAEQTQLAAENNARALARLRDLTQAIPPLRNELGDALQSAGVIQATLAKSSAKDQFAEARAIFVGLVKQVPNDWQYRDRLGNAVYELAKLAYASGNRPGYEEAKSLVGSAIADHQLAYRATPDAATAAHLASDYYLLAWSHAKLSDFKQAAKTIEAIREPFEKSGSTDPEMAAEILAWPTDLARLDLPAAEKARLTAAIDAGELGLLAAVLNNGLHDVAELKKSKPEGGRFYRLHGPVFDKLLDAAAGPNRKNR